MRCLRAMPISGALQHRSNGILKSPKRRSSPEKVCQCKQPCNQQQGGRHVDEHSQLRKASICNSYPAGRHQHSSDNRDNAHPLRNTSIEAHISLYVLPLGVRAVGSAGGLEWHINFHWYFVTAKFSRRMGIACPRGTTRETAWALGCPPYRSYPNSHLSGATPSGMTCYINRNIYL
jgi:hypothetical protein